MLHRVRASRILLPVLAGLAVGCLLPSRASAAEPAVVVTSKPIHSLVAMVMGATGTPRLLVDGNASPHTYAMKPSDAKAVHEAHVFFRVSEGLEPFTRKLTKALPAEVRVITLEDAPGIRLLDRRRGGPFEAHADGASAKGHAHGDHDDDHDGLAGRDPHIWLDPGNASAMVDHIAATLSAVHPGGAAAYRANADAAKTRISTLSAELERELAPIKGRPFIIFHDATQYFERRFGLAAAGSITVSPEVQPSAKRLRAVRAKISKVAASCVFAEPQFKSKIVETVVEGTTAKTGTLDPEGGLLKPGPDLYPELMRGLAASMKDCLAGSS